MEQAGQDGRDGEGRARLKEITPSTPGVTNSEPKFPYVVAWHIYILLGKQPAHHNHLCTRGWTTLGATHAQILLYVDKITLDRL
jgi:hypothetical protein